MDIDVSGCSLSGSSLVNDPSIAAMARHSESSSVQSARVPFAITNEREGLASTHWWIYKSLGRCQGCEGARVVYICRMYSMRQRYSFIHTIIPFHNNAVSPRLRVDPKDVALFIVHPIPLRPRCSARI